MILSPNSTASVQFQIEIGGEVVNGTSVSAQVYKGSILTAVTPTVTNPATGQYWVSFTVPSNWVNYDAASVRLTATVNGLPIELTKPAGTVFLSAVDLSPVQSVVDAIFAVVDQIQISSGRVVATLNGETVVLPAGLEAKVQALVQMRGLDPSNPYLYSASGQQSSGSIVVNVVQAPDGSLTFTRAS